MPWFSDIFQIFIDYLVWQGLGARLRFWPPKPQPRPQTLGSWAEGAVAVFGAQTLKPQPRPVARHIQT